MDKTYRYHQFDSVVDRLSRNEALLSAIAAVLTLVFGAIAIFSSLYETNKAISFSVLAFFLAISLLFVYWAFRAKGISAERRARVKYFSILWEQLSDSELQMETLDGINSHSNQYLSPLFNLLDTTINDELTRSGFSNTYVEPSDFKEPIFRVNKQGNKSWGRPAVFIGLGRFGQMTLRELEERLLGLYGPQLFKVVRLLTYDTEDIYSDSQRKNGFIQHVNWQEPDVAGTLSNRARMPGGSWLKHIESPGMGRVWGRLAFFHNRKITRDTIEQAIKELASPQISRHGIQTTEGLNVFIVSTSGGSTGAGSVLDISSLVNATISDISTSIQRQITLLVGLTESVTNEPSLRELANTYTLLSDLKDLTDVAAIRQLHYYGSIPQTLHGCPYDFCYFVCNHNDTIAISSPAQMANIAGRALALLGRQSVIHPSVKAHLLTTTPIARFASTFGLANINIPINRITSMLVYRATREYLQDLNRRRDENLSSEINKLRINQLLHNVSIRPNAILGRFVALAQEGQATIGRNSRFWTQADTDILDILKELESQLDRSLESSSLTLGSQAATIAKQWSETTMAFTSELKQNGVNKTTIAEVLHAISRILELSRTLTEFKASQVQELLDNHHSGYVKQKKRLSEKHAARKATHDDYQRIRQLKMSGNELEIRLRAYTTLAQLLSRYQEFIIHAIVDTEIYHQKLTRMIGKLERWEENIIVSLKDSTRPYGISSPASDDLIQFVNNLYKELIVSTIKQRPFDTLEAFSEWTANDDIGGMIQRIMHYYWGKIHAELESRDDYRIENFMSNLDGDLRSLFKLAGPLYGSLSPQALSKTTHHTVIAVCDKDATKVNPINLGGNISLVSTGDMYQVEVIRFTHGLSVDTLPNFGKYHHAHSIVSDNERDWAYIPWHKHKIP